MQAGLQAQAIKQADSATHQLAEGKVVRLGRAPQNGLPIPWDMAISREHAEVTFQNGHLRVRCLDNARNPISYNGQRMREAILPMGESFRIGTTEFRVIHPPAEDEFEDEGLVREHAFSRDELKCIRFSNADQQLDLLSRLPSLIAESNSDDQFASRLAQLLLDAIPQAEAVAVVRFDDDTQGDSSDVQLLRVDTREGYTERFRPSQRLMARAVEAGQSVIHIWDGELTDAQFTVCGSLGWAFCAPILGESCQGWCLYVSGQGSRTGSLLVSEEDLKSDLRYTELVAQFIGSVRQVRVLEEQKTQLSSFFSPKVIENLTSRDTDLLEPAERDITVLFCDVRGFSRKSEEMRGDLHGLLRSVREALGLMTTSVIERDGAIADFQGDAVLGFWGWPVSHDDGPLSACRAALAINRAFEDQVGGAASLLRGFSVGIGVAHGNALAGQIGTKRQAKVGVFGPIVNQGSRLEGLTKRFGVPICISDSTAKMIEQELDEEHAHLRRLACVRPAGMETAVMAYALVPGRRGTVGEMSSQSLDTYDDALDALMDGCWADAQALIGKMPQTDGPSSFLNTYLREHGPHAPSQWDGVISLNKK